MPSPSTLPWSGRSRSLAALALPVLCLALTRVAPAAPTDPDTAPAPRSGGANDVRTKSLAAAELDRALLDEIKANNEVAKNLEYLSDTIGPRLTGSKQLERANEWTRDKMKGYGLENVRLEEWTVPVGWERGPASMKVVEPDTGLRCLVASVGWTPGTKGKVTGEVVVIRGRNKADLDRYKGKLKNAVVLTSSPARVSPITDLSYGPLPPPPAKKDTPKKDEPKKDEPKETKAPDEQISFEQPGKDDPKTAGKKDEPKKPAELPPIGDGFFFSSRDLDDFLKSEGVACRLHDAGKPHGLLVAYGQWRPGDRGAQETMPRLVVAHEHYAMLFRLASRPGDVKTRVEVEASNEFVPGPITCYNTVGEVRGSEKPDEFVVVGAHLDSWDLATGTMDNGTGSCAVLETARAVAALAKKGYRPRRTIRFVLFTGEEQGLHGSKEYVKAHEDEMPRTSMALVHDTGTGRVYGFGVHGNEKAKQILEPELQTLATMDGWRGLDMGGVYGSDHQAFHPKGVPGFACRQDIDEYRLTHHTQTDTFDHAKIPNVVQGSQVMAVVAVRVANLPELLPRQAGTGRPMRKNPPDSKKDATDPKDPADPKKEPPKEAKKD